MDGNMIFLPLPAPLKKGPPAQTLKAGTADGTFDISTCTPTTYVVPGGWVHGVSKGDIQKWIYI